MRQGAVRGWILITAISVAICGYPLKSPGADASTDLRKPAPDAQARPYQARLEGVIRERYPELFTRTVDGIPIVTALFDSQGNLLRTDLEVSSASASELGVSAASFRRFGVIASDLQYVAEASVQLPANTVVVAFAGIGSRELDRALVRRLFPQVFAQGTSGSEELWILFDHEGRVLRTGEEHFQAEHLRTLLEKRYPGIRTIDMTVTPVSNSRGRPLQLSCVWLSSDSPLPES